MHVKICNKILNATKIYLLNYYFYKCIQIPICKKFPQNMATYISTLLLQNFKEVFTQHNKMFQRNASEFALLFHIHTYMKTQVVFFSFCAILLFRL